MAHFAELKSMIDPTGFTSDTHQVVQRVVVVGNDIAAGASILEANDMHVDGETWCVNFFKGGTWKQTSYNNNFRKQYCGKGYTFDAAKNKFLSPQPFDSWALDGNDDWQAPVTYPTDTTDKKISWDEAGQKWTAKDKDDNLFNWDASGLTWVSA